MKTSMTLRVCAAALLVFFSICVFAAPGADKPNIVFILTDDLGWKELGCYGQTKIKTPRVDSLAQDGMRFTRAYSGNAVCAPSRCVLMTGKHPGHAFVRNNKGGQKPEGQWPLSPGEDTIAMLLGKTGYKSGAFGKWGLGNTESTGNPTKKGFDRFFGYNCQAKAHTLYPESLWSDNEIFPLKNEPPVPGHAKLAPELDENKLESYSMFKGQDYAPERINGQALKFIRENKDGPFFCYYPTVIPHLALMVPDEDLEQYHKEGWEETPFTARERRSYTPHFTPKAGYAAFITKMDTYVGRILDLLDELGLRENTIVVFSSDNGATYLPEVDYKFFESVGPLRGLKGSLYEGGIRVPLLVRWPGKIPAGTESDVLTGLEDWLPTLLDLTGVEMGKPAGIDGVSLAPVLLGKTKPGEGGRDFLYREFPAYGGQQSVYLNGGKWKAIRQNLFSLGKEKGKGRRYAKSDAGGSDEEPGTLELYNLDEDIGETKNVAKEHPEIVARAEALMKNERIPSADFPFPALDGK